MDGFFDRLERLDPDRLAATAGTLLLLAMVAAYLFYEFRAGAWHPGGIAGAVLAVLLALIGLLYAFELGSVRLGAGRR